MAQTPMVKADGQNLGTAVSILGYTKQSGTSYTAPCDGYLGLYAYDNNSYIIVSVRSNANNTGGSVYCGRNTNQITMTFIKKGLRLQVQDRTDTSSNGYANFYPLE